MTCLLDRSNGDGGSTLNSSTFDRQLDSEHSVVVDPSGQSIWLTYTSDPNVYSADRLAGIDERLNKEIYIRRYDVATGQWAEAMHIATIDGQTNRPQLSFTSTHQVLIYQRQTVPEGTVVYMITRPIASPYDAAWSDSVRVDGGDVRLGVVYQDRSVITSARSDGSVLISWETESKTVEYRVLRNGNVFGELQTMNLQVDERQLVRESASLQALATPQQFVIYYRASSKSFPAGTNFSDPSTFSSNTTADERSTFQFWAMLPVDSSTDQTTPPLSQSRNAVDEDLAQESGYTLGYVPDTHQLINIFASTEIISCDSAPGPTHLVYETYSLAPDLKVEELSVDPPSPLDLSNRQVTVVISNVGLTAHRPTDANFIHTSHNLGDKHVLGTVPIPIVLPATNTTISWTFTYDQPAYLGEFGIEVDANQRTGDADYSNNILVNHFCDFILSNPRASASSIPNTVLLQVDVTPDNSLTHYPLSIPDFFVALWVQEDDNNWQQVQQINIPVTVGHTTTATFDVQPDLLRSNFVRFTYVDVLGGDAADQEEGVNMLSLNIPLNTNFYVLASEISVDKSDPTQLPMITILVHNSGLLPALSVPLTLYHTVSGGRGDMFQNLIIPSLNANSTTAVTTYFPIKTPGRYGFLCEINTGSVVQETNYFDNTVAYFFNIQLFDLLQLLPGSFYVNTATQTLAVDIENVGGLDSLTSAYSVFAFLGSPTLRQSVILGYSLVSSIPASSRGSVQLTSIDVVSLLDPCNDPNIYLLLLKNADGIKLIDIPSLFIDTTDLLASYRLLVVANPLADASVSCDNQPPVCQDAVFTMDEDSVLVGNMLARDADGNQLIFSRTSFRATTLGVLSYTSNGRFTYTPHPNVNGADSFTFTAFDGQADCLSQGTITINIKAINDAPSIKLQPVTSQFIDANIPFATPIAISDIDAFASSTLSTTVTTPVGRLSSWANAAQPTQQAATITAAFTSTNAGSHVEVKGTLLDANLLLASLQYTAGSAADSCLATGSPVSNFTIVASVDDLGNTGGGSQTAQSSSQFVLSCRNHAPVITAPFQIDVTEDNNFPIRGIAVQDVDVAQNPNQVFTATATASHGRLSIGPDIRPSFTLKDTLSNINIALSGLTYVPEPNFCHAFTTTPVAVYVSVDDHQENGMDSREIKIIVNCVNDDAIIHSFIASLNGGEDAPIDFSLAYVSDVDSAEFLVDVSVQHGTLSAVRLDQVVLLNGGNGENRIVFAGSLKNVNALLSNTISYVMTPAHFSSPYTNYTDILRLQVSDLEQANPTVSTYPIWIQSVPDAPLLTFPTQSRGTEDIHIPIAISSQLVDQDGSEALYVDISLTEGATLQVGQLVSRTSDATFWRLSVDELESLLVHPFLHNSNPITMSVTAVSTEADTRASASTALSQQLSVQPVADVPILHVSVPETSLEDHLIPLTLFGALVDTDQSEFMYFQVQLPRGCTLSAASSSSASVLLLAQHLYRVDVQNANATSINTTVYITPRQFLYDPVDVHVTLFSEEKRNQDTANTSQSVSTYVVAVPNQPSVSVSPAVTDEDQPVALSIVPSLFDKSGGEMLSVLIKGVPSTASLSVGTKVNSTFYLLKEEEWKNVLYIPTPNNDADVTLVVYAVATCIQNSAFILSSPSTLSVQVNSVVDGVELSTSTLWYLSQASASQLCASDKTNPPEITCPKACKCKVGTSCTPSELSDRCKYTASIQLPIDIRLRDTDGSEDVTVLVGNVPPCAIVSAGVQITPTLYNTSSVYRLTLAEATNVSIRFDKSRKNWDKVWPLNITVIDRENKNGAQLSYTRTISIRFDCHNGADART